MTDKAHPEDDAPNAKFLHSSVSPTASTIGSEVQYPPTERMVYRVNVVAGGFGRQIDVEAKSGDEAADLALKGAIGGKVLHVEPAPKGAEPERVAA